MNYFKKILTTGFDCIGAYMFKMLKAALFETVEENFDIPNKYKETNDTFFLYDTIII